MRLRNWTLGLAVLLASPTSAETALLTNGMTLKLARINRGTPTSGSGAIAVFTFKGLKPGNASLAVSELTVSTPEGIQRVELGGPVRVTVQP